MYKAVETRETDEVSYWFDICKGVGVGVGTCYSNSTGVCAQLYDHGWSYQSVGRLDTFSWALHPKGKEYGAVVTFSGEATGRSTVVTYECDAVCMYVCVYVYVYMYLYMQVYMFQ